MTDRNFDQATVAALQRIAGALEQIAAVLIIPQAAREEPQKAWFDDIHFGDGKPS